MKNTITEGNVLKGLLFVSLPIMASNILQSVLELADLYFVGRLGADAIAGVAMSATLIMALVTVIIGVVTATTAFISRAYGAKEYDQIGKLMTHALIIGGAFSLLLAGVGFFYSHDILVILGAEGPVATLGSQYLSTLLLGIVTMIELWILSSSFQSVGDSRTPMIVMICVNLVNIALNPLLIFGLWGFPAYGIVGSAFATITARGLGLITMTAIVLSVRTPLSFPRHFGVDLSLIVRLFRVALPNSIQNGVRSLSLMVLMAIVAFYGASAVSAYGIAIRMELVALMPGFAIATGTAVIVGQNLGAQSPERAEKGVMYSLWLYGGFMAAVALCYFTCADAIMNFFDPSGASTAIGVSYFHFVTPVYVLNAMAIILSFAMNGAGATKIPMYATIISLVTIQIPLAIIIPSLLGLGITGIWVAVVIAVICQFGVLSYLYRKGSWKLARL